MGDSNQLAWVARNVDLFRGPVLEVGARHYAASASMNYRSLCPSMEFMGVDMSAGENVDLVVDFTADAEEVRSRLGDRTFGTVICCSVLEHVDKAAAACTNILNVLQPRGTLFVSVPFVWRYHGYPSDYWRFTSDGVRELLRGISWLEERCTISSNAVGDEADLSADPNEFAVVDLQGGRSGIFARVGRRAQLALLPRRLRHYPYVLVPSMINLVGVRDAG